jgi:Cytochrome c peroxidase
VRKTFFTIFGLFFIAVSCTWLIAACRKDQPAGSLQRLNQEIPAGFPAPVYTFSDNPLTREGFELGRKLFYDGRLSIDNEHPCSSCHQQIAGFGTFEHDRSHGVNDNHTLRNAPVLFNLAWNTSFHWDGEFPTLIDEAVHPIHGNNEMGESFEGVIAKLQDDPEYQRLFKEVFRYPFIRPEYILKALSQFTGYLVSANSKYDRYKKGLEPFFPNEENGYQLFKANCASCHPEPLFTDYSFRNIGLPVDNSLKDYGRMRVTGIKADSLKFRVPTLRNVYISSNFMHDGRFGTLGQCINHYRTGVQPGPTLDPLLAGGIPLTNTEASDIATFLRTLTDSAFITDPRFAAPR